MFDPRKRTKDWQSVGPGGVYLDPDGFIHIFPDEVCAVLDIPYTRENYDMIIETLMIDMPRLFGLEPSKGKLIYHEREIDA